VTRQRSTAAAVPSEAEGAPAAPSWLEDAVFYQIFPDRFANADPSIDPEGVEPWGTAPTRGNFLGGDLAGIRSRLDHIQELGANALYLTPIFEADTNHRYDTADYGRIDHRLGDLESFRALLRAAHERGMRVVLDAVFNHCGEGHWAFRHVRAFGRDSPYAGWFTIDGFPIVRDPEPNYATCMGCKYLPQFNHANPEVRDYLFGVTRQWLAEGIDGWRLDVPFLIEKGFWREFRSIVKGTDPDLYIVAELWETATDWLQGDLADGAMNYPLRELIAGYAEGAISAGDFAKRHGAFRLATPDWAAPGMLNLLGSHDTERIRTRLGGDRDLVRLAVALQLTSPGAPMIYYGDEVGLEGGNDPECRASMPWDSAQWDRELLEWHRLLLRLRREHRALRGPDDRVVHANGGLVVRRRTADDETLYLVVNRDARAAELAPWIVAGARHDLVTDRTQGASLGGAIVVPPFGVMILARG
jgi:glycosidase